MWNKSLKILPLLFAAGLPAADRYQSSEPHMGTLVAITLYAESPEQAQRGFVAAFDRIKALNSILSDYDPNSELSRVCDSKAPLSPELAKVLMHAQRLAEQTEGAFDITAGPLTRLWRQARADRRPPSSEQIEAALGKSGYRKLRLSENGRKAQCMAEGMQLDSGGIAKGYAADEALATLASLGISSALVALSGDIAVGDPPPGRSGWRVRVQDELLTLANAAVSTSGDQFQFIQIDGVRYSHILDPRTGRPLQGAPTVSVIARTGIDADSMATALSVTGLSKVKSLELPSIRKQSGGLLIDLRPLSTLLHGQATDHARVRCA